MHRGALLSLTVQVGAVNWGGAEIAPGTANREVASGRSLLNECVPVQGRDVFGLYGGLGSIRHYFGELPLYVADARRWDLC